MAVSDDSFPARKRRPAIEAFVSPNKNLLQSLFLLSQQISSLHPLRVLLKKTSASIIRKSKLVSVMLEELVQSTPASSFPPSAALCFEELYIVFQRIKVLLEDCSASGKLWLLMQLPSISSSFQLLTAELSTLLDIFPAKHLNLNQDVDELLLLIKKQCAARSAECMDSDEANLRIDVLRMLGNIKREIVPDYSELTEIFIRLDLSDCTRCCNEIQNLEDEVPNQNDDKTKADVIALIGLVRYAKCVLYGDSTPTITTLERLKSTSEVNLPADFRCPISLDLMRDPVVASTGQTYDRPSITAWIESGHATCPKTGQTLAHTKLIPNLALKNLIAMWCRQQRIPFRSTEVNVKLNPNKTAMEATKMTVSFLVKKLTVSEIPDTTNRLVHELRVLAKTDSDSRTSIAEAGALPLLVKSLGPEHPSLQINTVTTILNLSILDANKVKIVETDGVLNGIIEVLRSGATWEAKGNAAATIFSLTGVHAYRKRLSRKTRVVRGLLDLAKAGPVDSKRDAMMAILNMALDREGVGKLIEGGVVDVVGEVMVMDVLTEESVAILEAVVKRGGLAAISAVYHGSIVKKLTKVLREGSERAREAAAATLVNVCRKGGSEMVGELAAVAGVERVVWEMMGMGTGRGRRKAVTLLKILRRWAAGLVSGEHLISSSVNVLNMNLNLNSS